MLRIWGLWGTKSNLNGLNANFTGVYRFKSVVVTHITSACLGWYVFVVHNIDYFRIPGIFIGLVGGYENKPVAG